MQVAVQINNPLPAGASEVLNTTRITDNTVEASDSEATPIIAAYDLQIAKSADVARAVPGQLIVYTLRYTNTGNIEAVNVPITKPFRPTPSLKRAAARPAGAAPTARQRAAAAR